MLTRLVAVFFFLLPFQFAINLGMSIEFPLSRVFSLGIILIWLLQKLSTRNLRFPPLLITGSTISFLFIASTSLLWATDASLALRKIIFLWNFFPLIFVFSDLGRQREARILWIKALVLGGGLVALVSLALFFTQFVFGLDPVLMWIGSTLPFFLGQNLSQNVLQYPSLLVNISGETWLRATGFFPDPHIASFFFGMVGFLSLGLFFTTWSKRWLSIIGLLILADLLTFSRGGYLGLLGGGLSFLLFGWKYFSQHVKKGIGGAIFLGLLLSLTVGQPILSRFGSSFTLADASSAERVILWQEAWQHILSQPFLGTGLGNYIVEARPLLDTGAPFYAHNLYLDIAVELGLLGLLFFLLPILIGYSNILENMRMSSNSRFLRLGLLSVLTLYLTHSLFETALFSVHILPLLLLTISLVVLEKDEISLKR